MSVRVSIHGVRFEGGPIVIERAQFEVRPAEILGVMAPSGAGKSTMLRLIAGVERAAQGEVAIDGLKSASLLFQDVDCFPWMTIDENVRFADRTASWTAERRLSLLRDLGLADAAMWPHELSGGMRKRVGLARIIVAGSDLLLLDEPFSSLDYMTRYGAADLIVRHVTENAKSAIVVSHSVEDMVMLTDRCLLSRQRVLSIDTECIRVDSHSHDVKIRLADDQYRASITTELLGGPQSRSL